MKKYVSSTLISAFVLCLSFTAQAESARQPHTVIELFTSQGCSSCPPADKIMGDLVKTPGILGLSFAVTYWDYIGWKDTFGNIENDTRQVRYRDQFSARYVYTPQMVIGGQDHFVGSNPHELEDNLQKYQGHAQKLDLKWKFEGDKIHITLPEHSSSAVVWQVDLNKAKDVKIGRGENTGKHITYHNIVRKTQAIGEWDGKPRTFTLDLADLMQTGRDGCAILIQEKGFGPIIAALEIDF